MALLIAAMFWFGACLGSFLNVAINRSIHENDVTISWRSWRGRSYCPACRQQLRWWELIPILSFTFLRGRCSRCGHAISVQYPIIELAMGLLAVIMFMPLPGSVAGMLEAIVLLGCSALIIMLFMIDLRTMLLPDLLIVYLTIGAIILVGIRDGLTFQAITTAMIGVAIGVGFLGALWLLTQGRGLGLGDVKLMIPLGIVLGTFGMMALLFISFMIGGLVSFILLLRGRAQLKTAIPFGPFLCGAALLLILWPTTAAHIFDIVFVGLW